MLRWYGDLRHFPQTHRLRELFPVDLHLALGRSVNLDVAARLNTVFFRSLLLCPFPPNTPAQSPITEFLANPAVQAGLAPVAVALVFSALLLRTGLMELAIGAGFATVIVLAIGFSFELLSAVCKIVLCCAVLCWDLRPAAGTERCCASRRGCCGSGCCCRPRCRVGDKARAASKGDRPGAARRSGRYDR